MKRIRELDIMRTAAMLLMVVYHVMYDLSNFAGIAISYYKPPLNLIGRFSALVFIFLSGISSGLGSKSLKRGALVFSCGMLITLVTFIFIRDSFVVFGILHLLGICMMLSAFMKKLPMWMLVFITAISAAAGVYFNRLIVETCVLLPIGIINEGFTSIDYYPLFPYISVFMAGMIYYRIFYNKKKSIFNLEPKNDIIERLSRRSLLIYLIHQPVILGILYIVIFIRKL